MSDNNLRSYTPSKHQQHSTKKLTTGNGTNPNKSTPKPKK